MRHLLAGENIALCALRQSRRGEGGALLAAAALVNKDVVSLFDIGTVFPLYLYPNGQTEAQAELVPPENGRRPNLAAEFVQQFAKAVGLEFVPDGRGNLKETFGPEDVFNYAYGIFHAPSYRERYAQFLKLGFPRLPVTGDALLFRRLSECGARLVGLHTLRERGPGMVSFDVAGSNIVERVVYVPPQLAGGATGRVYINRRQYFEGLLEAVWEFRVGGYQVCERWLKDRKGRVLGHDQIEHYRQVVAALAETRTLMAQIDALIVGHGNWPLRQVPGRGGLDEGADVFGADAGGHAAGAGEDEPRGVGGLGQELYDG